MTTISYEGQPVALSVEGQCVIAHWLVNRSGGDPDLRVVSAMCVFAMHIDDGTLPGPYDDEAAMRFARDLLIDPLEFAVHADESDEALARRFAVPVAQIAAKRGDEPVQPWPPCQVPWGRPPE